MALIDVSIFSKEDIITRCHPYKRCFYLCPLTDCGKDWWHFYNITKNSPIPDGKIIGKEYFIILQDKGLTKLAKFRENMIGRCDRPVRVNMRGNLNE